MRVSRATKNGAPPLGHVPSMAFTAPGATRWHELASYSFLLRRLQGGVRKGYSTAEEAHRLTIGRKIDG